MILDSDFFNRDCQDVAKALLGKVIRRKYNDLWLSAAILETEAYYLDDKASHASLGFTEKRKALFMEPGTIYMYYSRGGDSLNFSCQGLGNAVLIKAARILPETSQKAITQMQQLNPLGIHRKPRPISKLCSGQSLLCKALDLKVKEWDQKKCQKESFFVEDTGIRPTKIIVTKRLGIPKGRDEHLMLRFIDFNFAAQSSQNILKSRTAKESIDYFIMPY